MRRIAVPLTHRPPVTAEMAEEAWRVGLQIASVLQEQDEAREQARIAEWAYAQPPERDSHVGPEPIEP